MKMVLSISRTLLDQVPSWLTKNILFRLPRINSSDAPVYSTLVDKDDSSVEYIDDQEEAIRTSAPLAGQLRTHMAHIGVVVIAAIILLSEIGFLIIASSSGRESKQQTAIASYTESTYQATDITAAMDCGHSAESARSLNCHFDYLTISWEPPPCYHTDIVTDFLSARDWQFYNDTVGTVLDSWEEVGLGRRRYNVRWDFHFTHCMYVWKMMQKAVVEKRPLANNLLAFEHTRHCMEVGLDRRWGFEDLHTLVHVKWPVCLPYGRWNTTEFVE